jgi:flavin-binding protein dodecin
MSVSKISELIGASPVSFEEAAREVVERAHRTLRGVIGVEVIDKRVRVRDGRAAEYVVRLRLVFDLAPETLWHV